MLIEALLGYAHIAAILTLVVFITSEAALCRLEWMNAAIVRRLVRVDILYLVALIGVLITGVARAWWGIKGAAWYWQQPLLHLKITLFFVMGLLSIKPTLMFRQWYRKLEADDQLPIESEIRWARRRVMVVAHLLLLLPLAASLLARGIGTR